MSSFNTTNTADVTPGIHGIVDVMLIDKDTQEVVTHIRKENQITEAFARWVLAGNLANYNGAGTTVITNSISDLLSSKSRQRYQALTGVVSAHKFGIYLLSEDTPVKVNTQIPPYVDASLQALNKAVVYYGSIDTADDGLYGMAINFAGSKWSVPGTSPGTTVTYMKTDGAARIYSVILGRLHSEDGYIAVHQSPSVLPDGWDATWATSEYGGAAAADGTKTGTDAVASEFLVAPFTNTFAPDGRRGTCIYAPGQNINYVGFYNFVTKQYDALNASNTNKLNPLTGEYYNNNKTSFLNAKAQGGIAIGNGRAIRVNNGADSATQRVVKVYLQPTLLNSSQTPIEVSVTLEAGRDFMDNNITLNDSLIQNNAPVMVARPGGNADQDKIDVFVTMGLAEFRINNTNIKGFEIRRFTIDVGGYAGARTVTTAAQVAVSTPVRCAIIPFAIGQPKQSAGTTETTTAGRYYLQGYYDTAEDKYYLPFTHMLKGMDPRIWGYSPGELNAQQPMHCSKIGMVYGGVFNGANLHYEQDYLYALGDYTYMPCVTDEGLVPYVLNRTQRRAASTTQVMSGMTLDDPINKAENQILVVQYSYLFDIIPSTLKTNLVLSGNALSSHTIQVQWTVSMLTGQSLRLQYREVGTATWTDITQNLNVISAINIPSLKDATYYEFRMRITGGDQTSNWKSIIVRTLDIEAVQFTNVTVQDYWMVAQTPVESRARAYSIEYKKYNDNEYVTAMVWDGYAFVTEFNRGATVYIDPLEPNTQYDLRLLTVGYGSTVASSSISRTTLVEYPWITPTATPDEDEPWLKAHLTSGPYPASYGTFAYQWMATANSTTPIYDSDFSSLTAFSTTVTVDRNTTTDRPYTFIMKITRPSGGTMSRAVNYTMPRDISNVLGPVQILNQYTSMPPKYTIGRHPIDTMTYTDTNCGAWVDLFSRYLSADAIQSSETYTPGRLQRLLTRPQISKTDVFDVAIDLKTWPFLMAANWPFSITYPWNMALSSAYSPLLGALPYLRVESLFGAFRTGSASSDTIYQAMTILEGVASSADTGLALASAHTNPFTLGAASDEKVNFAVDLSANVYMKMSSPITSYWQHSSINTNDSQNCDWLAYPQIRFKFLGSYNQALTGNYVVALLNLYVSQYVSNLIFDKTDISTTTVGPGYLRMVFPEGSGTWISAGSFISGDSYVAPWIKKRTVSPIITPLPAPRSGWRIANLSQPQGAYVWFPDETP